LPRAQQVVKTSNELTSIKAALSRVFGEQSGFTLDYAEIVDPLTLQPVSTSFTGQVQVLMAGWVGSVRLIDNFSHYVKGRS